MKKFLSIALATVAIASCCAFVGCNGGEATVNYTLSEDGSSYIVSSVTGNINALTKYEIPSTYSVEEGGEQLPVTAVADRVFYHCLSLMSLTLPDTLKTIGDLAFAMSGLVNIDIPDSVETIGDSAFAFCPYLEEITIPSSVTSLGDRVFMNCGKLKKAEVYANVTELKDFLFYNPVISSGGDVYPDSALSEIVLSASITKIVDTALAGNPITDIYFLGTRAQWDALSFVTFEKKQTDDGKTEYVEKKVEKKEDCIHSAKVHCSDDPVEA